MTSSAKTSLLFVGTYTDKNESEGIYTYRFDTEIGSLRKLHSGPKTASPSFLAANAAGTVLYAVNETETGEVTSFTVDPADASLTVQSTQKSMGIHPCHIILDRAGKNVLVANYTSGTATSLALATDGSLKPGTTVQQRGTGPDKARQEAAHAHSANVDPSGKWILVADLGADKVFVYSQNSSGALVPHMDKTISLKAGCGPRHLSFHPNGKFVYIIGELNNTVTSFAWDARTGTAKQVSSCPTVPTGFSGKSYCADIHVHPNGRFVYGSNRGHDSIAIMKTDGKTGAIALSGTESVRGKWPRTFAIAPGGQFLLVAGQNSNHISVFKIDQITGNLTATGTDITVPSPVCLLFVGAK